MISDLHFPNILQAFFNIPERGIHVRSQVLNDDPKLLYNSMDIVFTRR